MKKLLVSSLCIIFFLASCALNHTGSTGAVDSLIENESSSSSVTGLIDSRPPSQEPPAGLRPEQCPQFIILGFDDNQYDDGMSNILAVLDGKKNPAGSGYAGTFDGTSVTASFYNAPAGRNATEEWTVSPETVAQWKRAYQLGHEMAVHTYYHEDGLQFTKTRWVDEMQRCIDFHVTKVGVPRSEIVGFRAPYLKYNANTFLAMLEVGLQYDCSYEGGWRWWPREDGSTLYWPFTLENGGPSGSEARPLPQVPGVWEIPTDCIFLPDGSRVTGFDFNLWFSKSMTKNEFVNALKYSLDKKYYGNRSPMNIGLHTNYYSDKAIEDMKIYDPGSIIKLKSTVLERTQALDEFVQYALTLPDVRIVRAKDVLEWVKNPIPPTPQLVSVTASSGPNGSWDKEGVIPVVKGSTFTFTAQPDPGYAVDTVTVNGFPVQLDENNRYTLTAIMADSTIYVTFRLIRQFTITVTSGLNGSWSREGQLTVNEHSSLELAAVPDKGFVVDKIFLDDIEVTNPVFIPHFTLPNIRADHTLHITFRDEKITGLDPTYVITMDWGTGFGGELILTNNTQNPIYPPSEIIITFPGDLVTINSMWNAAYIKRGQSYVITLPSWIDVIHPGMSITIGFNGTYQGTNVAPEVVIVP